MIQEILNPGTLAYQLFKGVPVHSRISATAPALPTSPCFCPDTSLKQPSAFLVANTVFHKLLITSENIQSGQASFLPSRLQKVLLSVSPSHFFSFFTPQPKHQELLNVSLRPCVCHLAAHPCKSDKYLKDPYPGKIEIITLN